MTSARLSLDGMTCASCVARVERVLKAQEGVSDARVNLSTETAEVDFAAPASVEAMAVVLGKAGYPVRQGHVSLSVEGMTCASCVGRVERVLRAQPGVAGASVNLATRRAEVDLWQPVEAGHLAAAVSKAGYPTTPLAEAAAHDPEAELRALWRDTAIAGALTLPVFLAEMGGHVIPGFHMWLHGLIGVQSLWLIEFVLVTLVMIGPGLRFYLKGLPALLHGAPEMNSLVAVGTLAAWGYSTLVLFWPALVPEASRAVYFEAAAVIVVLILLGRALETRARGQAGAAIARLVELAPRVARRVRDGVVEEVEVAALIVGDQVQIRPGERIPADGVVVSGHSAVDEAMLTGEAMAQEKQAGDALTGGTVNGTGALVMEVRAVGAATVLARIIEMVEAAQGGKLPVQALVDRITGWFVPVVMGIAVATGLVWLAFGGVAEALVAAVSVLIIACPCAMGLATPVSILVGTGRAAELGVLFRKGEALQRLEGVQRVAFDKTGTLTAGKPVVQAIEGDETLAIAAAVEAGSEHPLASAVLAEAARLGVAVAAVSGFEAVPGHGARAWLNGDEVSVGSARMFAVPADMLARAEAAQAKGQGVLYVGRAGAVVGMITVADPIKPEAKAAVAALRGMGISSVMITGDAEATARAVAAELGIEDVRAGILPQGKAAAIEALGAGTVFVGDGINDAPALAQADVGIAMGTGTDVAIEAGDVVLMRGDPLGVVDAVALSRAVMRNIRQNLTWAFGYNAALIPVAAGALVPFGGPQMSPMLGAGAMALSSVFVLGNALRLRRFRRSA
jgi:P-type Cu+ transporter